MHGCCLRASIAFEFWACINFSRMTVVHIYDDLIDMCCSKGMEHSRRPLVPVRNAHGAVEKTFIDLETFQFMPKIKDNVKAVMFYI
ncbi:hypothetical protein SASPL_119478 [Salvia splendens]|uniref:Uncharacterized protein n=1 Tax=Salvia splendens TaxID=180675 RepID=A0A8X8XRI2_SALSN|nr:hypothetical protein SASPL_119478 [Salvia splendens]